MRRSKHHIVSLIKITNHPDDVLAGNLYCNRLQFYRDAEMSEIGDKFEGTAVSKKMYKMIDGDLLFNPVYCMYAVVAKEQDEISRIKLSDDRLKDFGKHAIVITDVKAFINRLEENLNNFAYELVRYIDMKNPDGIYESAIFNPMFTKDKYFQYQQEFRIFSSAWALSNKTEDHIPNVNYVDKPFRIFPIGGLSDITKHYRTEDLFSGVDVELKVDWHFCRKDNFQTRLPRIKN